MFRFNQFAGSNALSVVFTRPCVYNVRIDDFEFFLSAAGILQAFLLSLRTADSKYPDQFRTNQFSWYFFPFFPLV